MKKPTVHPKTLERWAEMTSENDHRRVREAIAAWLCVHVHPSFIFYAKLFESMEQSLQYGFVPHEFLPTECSVTDIMFEDLEKNYKCNELSEQIKKCL